MSTDNSLPTASEGNAEFSFNGVFRDVHSKESRDKLRKAQCLISESKWDEANSVLKNAVNSSSDQHDVRNLGLIIDEVAMYRKRLIPDDTKADGSIDWSQFGSRAVEKYFEKFEGLPQSVFLLKSNKYDRVLVGRRILSHQFVRNKIRELHCSHVTPSMLLGKLVDQRLTEDGVALYYQAMTAGEKLCFMEGVLNSGMSEVELTYPFPALVSANRKEIQSPEEGWEIDEKLALSLGEGEVYLREYSLRFLKSIGREDLRLFDCACSTGQFLSTMKQGMPMSHTIGQDLSAHMVKFATKRVDEIYCGNALEPKVPDQNVDIVFVRFINSEVVKTEIASMFLKPLTKCLKVGGYLVIFGHTPVLTSAAEIKMLVPNLEITQSVGGCKEWNGIFQFYTCKRTE